MGTPSRSYSTSSRSFIRLWGIVVLALSAGTALAADPSVPGYADCTKPSWPTIDDAESRAIACSRALQSKALSPDGVALARLARGAARYALGEKLIASEDYREALRHYDGAIDPRNPDALALYHRGVAHDGLGNTDRALSDLNEAIRLDSAKALPYFERGELLARRSRAFARAIDDFNRALELQPGNVDALMARGAAYSELGQQARAIADLDRAVQLAPGSSEAHHSRAVAFGRVGDSKRALEDYDAALKLNAGNVGALVDRAGLQASLKNYELAIQDLDAAISISADGAAAHYNRGFAHFARGDYDKAITDYSMAIALDPALATPTTTAAWRAPSSARISCGRSGTATRRWTCRRSASMSARRGDSCSSSSAIRCSPSTNTTRSSTGPQHAHRALRPRHRLDPGRQGRRRRKGKSRGAGDRS